MDCLPLEVKEKQWVKNASQFHSLFNKDKILLANRSNGLDDFQEIHRNPF